MFLCIVLLDFGLLRLARHRVLAHHQRVFSGRRGGGTAKGRGTRKVEARVRAHAESREARCLTPLAGILEGQSLGREKGRELGHELGFYAGCAECWYSVHARDAP